MFIHGVTCWTSMGDEETVRDELDRWNACYDTLKSGFRYAA